MIELNGKPEVTVSVGQLLVYKGHEQESVGFFLSCDISNPDIVVMESQKIEYAYPEKMESGMTGADDAVRIFTLKAVSPGTTHLSFTLDFRGDIESREVIKVVVNRL